MAASSSVQLGFYKGSGLPTHREHSDSVADLVKLGMEFCNKKDYENALETYQKALEMHQRLHGGGDHLTVAEILSYMGEALGELKKPEKMLEKYREASEIYRRLCKEEHQLLEFALALECLAVALGETGNKEKALEVREEALEVYQKFYRGHDSRNVALCLSFIAENLEDLEELDKALEFRKKASSMYLRIHFGEDHPDMISSFKKLALLQARLGKHESAVKNFQLVAQMSQSLLETKDYKA